MTDPLINLLSRLSDNGVDYVLISGMAAILHGANVVTRDVDIVTSMEFENILRIEAALRPVRPRWRMRPDRQPLGQDEASLRGLKNLYLETDEGVIDILGELPDVCTFEELVGRTQAIEVEGLSIKLIDIDTLIAAKRAAGRPRDLYTIRLLEEVKARRNKS